MELDSSGVKEGSCPPAAAVAVARAATFGVNSLEAAELLPSVVVVEVALVLALDALDSLLELGLATRGQDDIYRDCCWAGGSTMEVDSAAMLESIIGPICDRERAPT